MASVDIKINASDLRNAIKQKVSDPIIALSKNPVILRQIAEKALEIDEPYVPYKSGDLNSSGHVVSHARQTRIVWGKPGVGKTMSYAAYQHDNIFRHRTRTEHPLAKSFWTKQIMPGSPGFRKLVTYAKPLVKKEVKNGSR